MLATLVLLAQVSAATPAAEPIQAASNGQTRTLADVARERKLGKKGVTGGTMSVAGAAVLSGAAGAKPAADSATLEVDAFQATWIKRNADARAELREANDALAQVNASLPAAVAYGRGAAHTQAILNQVREGTLAPYRARVSEAQAKVNALPEEARRAGAQPGWVR